MTLKHVRTRQCLPKITFFDSAWIFRQIGKTKGQSIDRKMDGCQRRIFQVTLNCWIGWRVNLSSQGEQVQSHGRLRTLFACWLTRMRSSVPVDRLNTGLVRNYFGVFHHAVLRRMPYAVPFQVRARLAPAGELAQRVSDVGTDRAEEEVGLRVEARLARALLEHVDRLLHLVNDARDRADCEHRIGTRALNGRAGWRGRGLESRDAPSV